MCNVIFMSNPTSFKVEVVLCCVVLGVVIILYSDSICLLPSYFLKGSNQPSIDLCCAVSGIMFVWLKRDFVRVVLEVRRGGGERII